MQCMFKANWQEEQEGSKRTGQRSHFGGEPGFVKKYLKTPKIELSIDLLLSCQASFKQHYVPVSSAEKIIGFVSSGKTKHAIE